MSSDYQLCIDWICWSSLIVAKGTMLCFRKSISASIDFQNAQVYDPPIPLTFKLITFGNRQRGGTQHRDIFCQSSATNFNNLTNSKPMILIINSGKENLEYCKFCNYYYYLFIEISIWTVENLFVGCMQTSHQEVGFEYASFVINKSA